MRSTVTPPTFRAAGLLLAALLFDSSPAAAQQQAGSVSVRVADDNGGPLPGASIVLTGMGARQASVSDAAGDARFLNLAPGTYAVEVALQGFTKVNRGNVTVSVGKNTALPVALSLSGVQESIVVTSETPILDTRKVTSGVNVAKLEMEAIPTARDPWVVMQSVPGILMDRVNVAGNESGQQSGMVNKGAGGSQTVWNIDGVNITDMASQSSPGYYDFDSFEEIQVATGGSDVSIQTPGVQMNLVTKRGTNDVKGTARVLITDGRWQADNISDELRQQLSVTRNVAATNQIEGIQDYGVDVGGPIIKDHLWLWGAYARNQIDLLTVGGSSDKTTLENINAKLNASPFESNSITATFSRGEKLKFGRNVGPTRPAETGWNQKGPTTAYKLEDSHVFSPNVFASALVSKVESEFNLISQGRGQTFLDEDAVWHGSYYDYGTERPQTQVSGNASVFARTGGVSHEVKVGFGWRRTPVTSTTAWPQGLFGCGAGICLGDRSVNVTRDGIKKNELEYFSAHLSDTISIGDLTLNAGVRWDRQKGKNLAFQVPASRVPSSIVPNNILGALDVPEQDPGFEWTDLQPRLGATWAVGRDRKTLLRASYARFADQLGGIHVTYNSLAPGLAGIYYAWNDVNGNDRVDAGEADTSEILNFYGVDPENPSSISTPPNLTSPDLSAGKTDEILLGLEREIAPALAVSVSGTYRKLSDFIWSRGIGLTRNDYVEYGRSTGTLPDGTRFDVPYYGLRPGVTRPGGRILENRSDYTQEYKGLELQLTKRYASRWMARASFTYGDWDQNVGAGAIVDPTDGIDLDGNSPLYLTPGFNTDGGLVVQAAGAGSGAKGAVYLNSRWQVTASGMYSLPHGFNVAASFFAREGYPVPYFSIVDLSESGVPQPPAEGSKYVLASGVDDYRLPTVTNLDLRLEKVIKVSALDISLGVDVFNVLNANTVLQRQNQLGLARTNYILEAQTPRVVRFGGRLSF